MTQKEQTVDPDAGSTLEEATLERVLRFIHDEGATRVELSPDELPRFFNGNVKLKHRLSPIRGEDCLAWMSLLLGEDERKALETTGSVDVTIELPGLGFYRLQAKPTAAQRPSGVLTFLHD